jgi:hypothetical protein
MVVAITVTAILSFSVVRIVTVFLTRNRLPGASAAPAPQIERIDERLARIEQAVDAMAIEVERISEGQRFTTKLLSERARETT